MFYPIFNDYVVQNILQRCSKLSKSTLHVYWKAIILNSKPLYHNNVFIAFFSNVCYRDVAPLINLSE